MKSDDAGLFEVLDRIMDQGISFEPSVRLTLPTAAPRTPVSPVYIWTYLHFGEMAA